MLVATIRTVDPGVLQTGVTCDTDRPPMVAAVAPLNRKEDYTCHDIGANENPANRRDAQKIAGDAVPPAEQPEVARQDGQDHRQTKDNKPGALEFSKCNRHALKASFIYLHQGQYLTQLS